MHIFISQMNRYAVRLCLTVMLLLPPFLASYAGEGRGVIRNLNDTLPSRWVYNEHFDQTIPTDDGWWKKFNDPLLDSLIAMGVNNNYNVAMAARRMEMARSRCLRLVRHISLLLILMPDGPRRATQERYHRQSCRLQMKVIFRSG